MQVSPKQGIEAVQGWLRDATKENSLDDALKLFHEQHGIRGKTDGQLLILDYDQITVRWSEPYGHVCRGLILDAKSFAVIAFGLMKFFNVGEPNAAPIDWASARVVEKLDGTMVQRFWNPYSKQFEFSTRFQLPRDLAVNKVQGFNITWQQLIGTALVDMGPIVQGTKETITLEVMSPYNRVVVSQPHPTARIIALRHIDGSFYYEESPGYAGFPDHFLPKTYDLSSEEECRAFAEQVSGLEMEGFVVCDMHFNRVKIKGSSYVQLHRLKDGINSFGAIVMLAKQNDYDEIVAHFPEFKDQLDQAARAIQDLVARHEQVYEETKDLEVQKDFALAITNRGLEMTSALFQTRAGKHPSVRDAIYAMRDSAFIEAVRKVMGGPLLAGTPATAAA